MKSIMHADINPRSGSRPAFTLAPSLDAEEFAGRFAETGRVQISTFLGPGGAEGLSAHLRLRDDWRLVVNSGEKVFELDRATRSAMTAAQVQALDDAVYAGARGGFQYRYETIPVPDGARDSEDMLTSFANFLSAGSARAFLRKVTGQPSIAFADAQATAYSPGDFLTGHDDEVEGKSRLAAYVFSLSPGWRVEWGGLLLFHGHDGRVEGSSPRFGALNIFSVPQVHSVSMVTRAASLRRYSITGWLRAGEEGPR